MDVSLGQRALGIEFGHQGLELKVLVRHPPIQAPVECWGGSKVQGLRILDALPVVHMKFEQQAKAKVI